MTVDVSVTGIGLLGPGLADWARGRDLIGGSVPYARTPTTVPAPDRLPPTERRRAGVVVKASIVVADAALAAAARAGFAADPSTLPTVFASSTGDPVNCHQLCEALATAERLVSPTRFTNSVHNAPAGYWHIATASRAPSTSLAAHDASFGAGLLEAAVQCSASRAPVLLVACDVPYPEPLHSVRPVADTFAVALLLAPPAGARWLRLHAGSAGPVSACDDEALDELRRTIPAACALPLLQALARDGAARVVINCAPGATMGVDVGAR